MEDKFRFRKHISVGAAAAEDDHEFLSKCFVDTGDLEELRNSNSPKRIILGRTGSGKSALLSRLMEEENVISINPESLSFNYISNSTVLRFFLEAGVKLDLFFKLLWRHVFTVELIKKKYNIVNESSKKSFLDRFKISFLQNKKKEKAISYILEWGEKFWQETEYRIQEMTRKMEDKLKAGIETDFKHLQFNASAVTTLSDEEKKQIVHRGQNIINSIQMKELTDIIDFLNEDVFSDKQQQFYICIDRLDENWVDDKFKLHLIRSLVDTVRDFLRIEHVKIIIVLRTDLIERVFRLTRDSGFQEEKYRSLYLPIKWTDSQLKELLINRVNYLVEQRYQKGKINLSDIIPFRIDKLSAIDYMIQRTLRRPRELIEFFNTCLEHAEGRATISKKVLLSAEGDYSKNRLRSLQDEWFADHPRLIETASFFLKGKPKRFKIVDIEQKEIEEFCLDYAVNTIGNYDHLSLETKNVAEGLLPIESFIRIVFHILYKTGIIGLKTESHDMLCWSYEGPSTIYPQDISMNTGVAVHPTFHRVLGIKT